MPVDLWQNVLLHVVHAAPLLATTGTGQYIMQEEDDFIRKNLQ